MKRITLRADEKLIEQARLVAQSQHKTLSVAFRERLEQFVTSNGNVRNHDALMRRLKYVNAGRQFSRAEMNHR